MGKQRWQNSAPGNGRYVLRQTDPVALAPPGPEQWRNRRVPLSGKLARQSNLLRIPLTFLCGVVLLSATVCVIAWLQPIPKPHLITVSSAIRRLLMQTNTFATHDARAIAKLSEVFDTSRADSDSLNHDEMLALIKKIGGIAGAKSRFAWRKSTNFIYVNAPGVAVFDGAQDQLVPYLLPDDFVVHWNGESAVREHAIPLALLLDHVAMSKTDYKVLVLDC